MNACHVLWTVPYLSKNKVNDYNMRDYEILVMILSALKWREKNGDIKMITDTKGLKYLRQKKLDFLWNRGIYTYLDYIPKEIDANVFWALGKIITVQREISPFVLIDTDMIVWDNITEKIKKTKVCVIHKEVLNNYMYVDKQVFFLKENYKFNEEWNWNVKPCNTALLYINDSYFKNYYADKALEFVRNIITGNEINEMIFAEQRLLSICADNLDINIETLLNENNLKSQKQFTHIWGYKKVLNNNEKKEEELCKKCVLRLFKDFPQYEKKFYENTIIMKYKT